MNPATQSDRAQDILPEERQATFSSRSRLFRIVLSVVIAVAVALGLFASGRRWGWHHTTDSPPIFNSSTFDMSAEFAKRSDFSSKLRVLFLCTGNSCRSQMAEGWARALAGEAIEPYSAGIEAHGLNPTAVEVMREAGVDISGQQSKTVTELKDVPLDLVVTICGHADEHCPAFPGNVTVIHVGFDDPPKLAKQATSREEELAIYRRVRDEIRAFVAGLPDNCKPGH